MLNSKMLFEAMDGIDDEFILRTDIMLGYRSVDAARPQLRLRTLIIAAVIAALMAAAATAAGFLGRRDRTASLPPDSAGTAQQVIIPNGFRDSPGYLGSLEWWAYLNSCNASGLSGTPEFPAPGSQYYSVARLYMADSPEKLQKLLDIARHYGLRLYDSCLSIGSRDDFELMTGIDSFTDFASDKFQGYIFEDCSFRLELEITAGAPYHCSLSRIRSGSVYPYGGVVPVQETVEEIYQSLKNQSVLISVSGTAAAISYVSSDGETFTELCFSSLETGVRDTIEVMKRISDGIDFSALCLPREETFPEFNFRDEEAIKEIKLFEDSPVYMAADEFNRFFTDKFRNPCFTGVCGTNGFPDIDAELRALAEKYSLTYAENLHTGNEFYSQAQCYDNGAWCAEISGSGALRLKLHYIPADALYTGLVSFTSVDMYDIAVMYTASGGETVALVSGAADSAGLSYALYNTGSAFVILYMNTGNTAEMEKAVDSIDWSALK